MKKRLDKKKHLESVLGQLRTLEQSRLIEANRVLDMKVEREQAIARVLFDGPITSAAYLKTVSRSFQRAMEDVIAAKRELEQIQGRFADVIAKQSAMSRQADDLKLAWTRAKEDKMLSEVLEQAGFSAVSAPQGPSASLDIVAAPRASTNSLEKNRDQYANESDFDDAAGTVTKDEP